MSRRVEDSMADAQRSDDEGCITEDFSDSRGSSETKENIGEVREHPAVNRCQEQSCQASKQIETILKVILSIHFHPEYTDFHRFCLVYDFVWSLTQHYLIII